MRVTKFLAATAFLASIIFSSSCQGKSSNVKLVNEEDSVSYALGLSTGTGYAQNLKEFPGEINREALIEGFIKGFNGDSSSYKISEEELRPFLQGYFVKLAQKEKEKADLENAKILFENRQKEGVKVTESGLQYKIIKEGNGAIPAKDDVVRVHYTGKFADGTIFDSSIERGKPAEFPVGGVIPGWTEALLLMPAGSKWELVIPSELGYGEEGTRGVPPSSILFFEVELLDIVPQANAAKK